MGEAMRGWGHPYALGALLLLWALFWFKSWYERKHTKAIPWPFLPPLNTIKARDLGILRGLILTLLVLGLAEPLKPLGLSKRIRKGIDIMLVVDTSGSMKAMDLTWKGVAKDRWFVTQEVLKSFLEKRYDDALGLISFGSSPVMVSPLTLDHDLILDGLKNCFIGMSGEETALGDALALAVGRFEKDAHSKVIILLTDGVSNTGKVSPKQAAKAAAALGIKVYTIGIGSHKPVPIPTPLGLQEVTMPWDEEGLKHIAAETGGAYFHAETGSGLKDIYDSIDRLEKRNHEHQEQKPESWSSWLAFLAFCFFCCELFIRSLGRGVLP
jgi:Ca-activated chloride channel family protein